MRPVRRVDDRRVRAVVELRLEVRDVVGQRAPRRPEHPAEAAFDGQRTGRPPGVLHEDVGRQRPPRRERPLTDLRIVAEQPHRRVRDREPGAGGAVVEELEPAVLVVRAAGNRLHVDLIEIVLARVLDDDAGLDRVPAFHQRHGVLERVDRPLRGRRIRTAVDLGEGRDRNGWNLVGDLLVRGKDVRVVDAGSAALVQIGPGEDVDEHLIERVRVGRLVDQTGPQRAGPGQRLRGVRPVPIRSRVRKGPAERIDRHPAVLRVAERDLVAVVEPVIEADIVLPLILRVFAAEDRVRRAQEEPRRRLRIGIEQREPGCR